jgi:hypothetical protein
VRFPRLFGTLLILLLLVMGSRPLVAQLAVQSISVMGRGDTPEVEIRTSGKITPETQIVTGPDRVVLDFPNSIPARTLRALQVNRGILKGVRFGQYQARPPITRVVLDLTAAHAFQVFPSGNSIVVKLAGPQVPSPAAMVTTDVSAATTAVPAAAPPPVRVEVKGSLLRIRSDKATLAEVLYEVQRQTGADIPIPAGAEQEQVVANLGPGPGREVLASLLNGSHFNYIFVGADSDPGGISQVLLTVKEIGTVSGAASVEARPVAYNRSAPPPPPPAATGADENDVNDALPDIPAPPAEGNPPAANSNPTANPPQ